MLAPGALATVGAIASLTFGSQALSQSTSVTAEGAVLKEISAEFAFTEGPSADAQGNVFFTDQPNDRIVRWDATTGALTDWLKPSGRSNGTFFDAHGNLLACADEKNELWSISPQKEVQRLLGQVKGKALNGPNDLWIRPDGTLYFTDPLYPRDYWERSADMQQDGQHVYFLAKGSSQPLQVTDDLEQPNGLIGTPDGKLLYVADIRGRKTYRYDIEKNGHLTNKQLFCSLGSDGMTLDDQGNVYLTGRGVSVYNPQGERIQHIAIPSGWTANVTFAGKDRNLLFITASRSVYTIEMKTRGAGPF
jgi:gluconolactonase